MILGKIEDLKNNIPEEGRLLCLDIGTKTIGLALSDGMRIVATPTETLQREKFTKDAEKLIQMIEEFRICAMVIGLPINMDGSEGPKCQSVRQFATNFLEKYEIPILMYDERLSSVSADKAMLEADYSRRKRKENIDKIAASYILQPVLDGLRT